MWQELADFCRTEGGGDAQFHTHAFSLRGNISVRHEDHVQYLAAADLNPEVDDTR